LVENNEGEGEADDSFLPSSVHGSPRHLKKLALNGLAVVSELNAPTFFITGTVNVNWPEIKDYLLPGQSAFDRPDLVVQVFHARTTKFITKLKSGAYFGDRKTVYVMYVYEYQWRGLPHFHLICRLHDVPDIANREACIAFVDENITAELPSLDNPKQRQLVLDFMIHKCAVATNGCKSKPTDLCKRGYGKGLLVLETSIDDRGFPVYRRRNEESLYVVPTNLMALEDWNGHLNFEYSLSVIRVSYLYKYLFKGKT
jgi:hypothetical protein